MRPPLPSPSTEQSSSVLFDERNPDFRCLLLGVALFLPAHLYAAHTYTYYTYSLLNYVSLHAHKQTPLTVRTRSLHKGGQRKSVITCMFAEAISEGRSESPKPRALLEGVYFLGLALFSFRFWLQALNTL